MMNCQQVQDELFAADTLGAESLATDTAAHLGSCAACQATLRKLQQLEALSAGLAVPASAPSSKQAFLDRLQNVPSVTFNRPAFRLRRPVRLLLRSSVVSWPRMAMAASVLLCAGLGLWLFASGGTRTATASEPLVDQLVDWNVQLASEQSSEARGRIYATTAEPLRIAVNTGTLPPDERELADKLLHSGASLADHVDPLDDAEHVSEVASLLLHRMQVASARGNLNALRRYSQNYALVSSAGAYEKLARAKRSAGPTTQRAVKLDRLERLLRQDAEMRERLEHLLEQSPAASRQEIRRALQLDVKLRKQKAARQNAANKHKAEKFEKVNPDDLQ